MTWVIFCLVWIHIWLWYPLWRHFSIKHCKEKERGHFLQEYLMIQWKNLHFADKLITALKWVTLIAKYYMSHETDPELRIMHPVFSYFLCLFRQYVFLADLYNVTLLLEPQLIGDETSHCARHRMNHPKNKPLSRKHLPSKAERAWELNLLVLITYDVLLSETFLIQRPQVNIWSI